MVEAMAVAFATVFLAELGDKSQLMALSLSARYRRSVLLLAVLAASTLTIGVSVVLGSLIGEILPTRLLTGGAGVLFLVFAGLTVWGADDEDDAGSEARRPGGFLTAVVALSAAELGDKTMIAAFALAATTSAPGVWIGGSLGMAAAGAVAVVIGSALWRRLDPRTVRWVSAILFAAVGAFLIAEALLS
jgi:Ca2+/H+ antiporter, TMEM165/GDT1 family